MSTADPPMNPWVPITTPIDLKHLGKLGEELGEASAAVSRCIIQGVGAAEPVTGKPNVVWLEDELADVLANIELVTQHFDLDRERMHRRAIGKARQLRAWHSMLTDDPPPAEVAATPHLMVDP